MFKKLIWTSLLMLSIVAKAEVELNVVTEEYPPFNYTEGGKFLGFGSEVVKFVLDEAKIKYKMHSYPWARSYGEALEKENTLIFTITKTAEREKLFKWIGPIKLEKFYFYSKKDRKLKLNSIEDAKKYKIGVVPKDVIEQYLLSKGFAVGKNVDQAYEHSININKLDANNIDFVPMSELMANYLIKKLGKKVEDFEKTLLIEEISKDGTYMAFSNKTSDEIVNKVKTQFEKAKANKSLDEILKKY